MTDREDRSDRRDVTDAPEWTVLRDRAETFLLGVLPPSEDDKPMESLLSSTFRLLGENCADLSSVGVPTLEEGCLGAMKPYRSTSAPSMSSQSSRPPANSVSRRVLSG